VFVAVDQTVSLLIAVKVERHFAVVALEAQFVVDLGSRFLSLLCIHGLAANLALLRLRGNKRHDVWQVAGAEKIQQ